MTPDLTPHIPHIQVKRSLQELSRAINGDAKTEVQPEHRSSGTLQSSPILTPAPPTSIAPQVQPLFKIYVTLQNSKVEFKPSIPELTQTVNAVAKAAISTVGARLHTMPSSAPWC